MSITKKCTPKLIIFYIENRLWKSNFDTFWHLLINPILKIQWFLLSMLILRQKPFYFCAPLRKLYNPYCHNVSIAGRVAGYSKRRSTWLVFPHGKVPRGLRSYKHLPYILYTIMTLSSNSPIPVPSNLINWEYIGNEALSQMPEKNRSELKLTIILIWLSFLQVRPFSFFHYKQLKWLASKYPDTHLSSVIKH